MSELDTEHRDALSKREFAFPEQRKEPIEDASHVRNAVSRFLVVEGVASTPSATPLGSGFSTRRSASGSRSARRTGAS